MRECSERYLFDFHRVQCAKKTGSIHATYILIGSRKNAASSGLPHETEGGGGDSATRSSPPASSMPELVERSENIALTSVMLAREEELPGIVSVAPIILISLMLIHLRGEGAV